MSSIQLQKQYAVQNQPVVESTQPNNLYRVNFRANEKPDSFEKETNFKANNDVVYQDDPLTMAIRKREKEQKKQKITQNVALAVSIGAGLAIIGTFAGPLFKSHFGAESKKIESFTEYIKKVKDPNIKREIEEEMARKDYERSLYRVQDLIKLDKLAQTEEKRTVADIASVKKRLDNEIIGMDEAKQPILDFLQSINYDIHNGINADKPIILALDGPPGTGKSSLMKAISDSLGMYFKKISLSATKNPESITGFERTYVGATPGMIAKAQLEGNTKKVVYGLDELEKADEKILNTFLSILDDQKIFTDRYYNTNVDLSQSMFIVTTNQLERLKGTPLYNRIKPHVIKIKPYNNEVKAKIAKQKIDMGLKVNKMNNKVVIDPDVYDTISKIATDDGGRYTTQLADKLIINLKTSLEESNNSKIHVTSDYINKIFKNIDLG